MTTPSHDEIAQMAQQLWQQRGCPNGRDTEIWLEAERKLNEDPAPNTFAARVTAEAASESEVENLLSPAESEQMSIRAALQNESARAPKVPRQTGPKTKPAETGKLLWDQPYSS